MAVDLVDEELSEADHASPDDLERPADEDEDEGDTEPAADAEPDTDAGAGTGSEIGSVPRDAAVPTRRGGMLRANVAVASGTAVSRLTGLVRTSLVLLLLGQGLNDAYVNANNTPNMIYELILGGILTAALVPLFTDDLSSTAGDGGHRRHHLLPRWWRCS